MFDAIIQYFSGTLGLVELAATVFSLICVWLAAKQNQWTWFWGVLGVVLFGYLFYEYKLYSDAGLQILFYLPLQFVGYYVWKRVAENTNDDNMVFGLSPAGQFMTVLGIGVLTVINGYLMMTYTDASFPYIDAFTTWMSVFAQILMIRKFWESWALWVTMDVVAIGVYYAKGLYVTSGLYVVFLCMATYGFIKWKQKFANRQLASAEV